MSKFGFVFPGQGTQHLNMLAQHYARYDIVRETFQQAAESLNFDIWQVVSGDDQALLDRTAITQPAVLTASIALWRLWCQQGGAAPSVLAGHSLGEYSALVCAGVLDFGDALRLVQARGEFMTLAIADTPCRMVAVMGMPREQIVRICDSVSAENTQLGLVSAVNFNSVSQTVIAGTESAVLFAEKVLKQQGASRILPLAVTVPSHCYLMKPAAEQLEALLETINFNEPVIEFVNNVDARSERDVARIKSALVRQLYCPVRWSEAIQYIEQNYLASCLVELGPGKTLAGLVKRIAKGIDRFSTCEPELFSEAFSHINK